MMKLLSWFCCLSLCAAFCTILTSTAWCAEKQDPPSGTVQTVPVKAYTPSFALLGGEGIPDSRFEVYDKGDALPADFPKTSFAITRNNSVFGIEIFLEQSGEQEESDTIELFFAPLAAQKDMRYHQYFGETQKEADIHLYDHGWFDGRFEYLNDGVVTRSFSAAGKDKPACRMIHMTFPWHHFQYALPFEDAPVWKFNLVRWHGNAGASWQGKLHKPETWGNVAWGSFSDAEQEAIYRHLIAWNAANIPPFDSQFGHYSESSYAAAAENYRNTCSELMKELENPSLPLDRIRKIFHLIRDLRQFHIVLASGCFFTYPENPAWQAFQGEKPLKFIFNTSLKKDPIHWIYSVENAPMGDLWLTECCTMEGKLSVNVELNNRKLTGFEADTQPRNIRLCAAGEYKKGDKVKVTVSKLDKNAKCTIRFFLSEYRCGMQPGVRPNVWIMPTDYSAMTIRPENGEFDAEQYSRQVLIQKNMLRDHCQVVFMGDSITDFFRGKAWAELAKFKPGNMGVSGDKTQALLWRVENSKLDELKPKAAVILIGTNNMWNSPAEVAQGIRAVIDAVLKKSPKTKILLLGLLPRNLGDRAVSCPDWIEQINDIISRFADDKTIYYLDTRKIWLDKDGKIIKSLMPDFLHPSQEGYHLMNQMLIPALDRIIAQE